MPKYLISLKATITIMDIVLEVDDFDPNSETDTAMALDHWLQNTDPRMFQAVEEVEVLHHRCLDDQPHWNRFEDSEHPLEPGTVGPFSDVDKAQPFQPEVEPGQLLEQALELMEDYINTNMMDSYDEWVDRFSRLLGHAANPRREQIMEELSEKVSEAMDEAEPKPYIEQLIEADEEDVDFI